MPKLSSFVKGGKGGDPFAAKGRRRDAPRSEKTQSQEEGRQAASREPAPRLPVEPAAKPAPRPETGVSKKALADHAATRVFRWPDGSLRKEKPPAKRNVVEARAEWEDIVDYCRRTGGCPHCAQGACLRHGFGVSARDHENYCREIGVWNQPVQDLKEKIYMEKRFQ